MRIDKRRASEILEDETTASNAGNISDDWKARLQSLEWACSGSNLTFFAALGTAMLAKTVEIDVDVFSLKSGDSDRGYSARSLCKDVLAANAPRLEIDLGVTGREPLNNQPFYAESRITDRLPVRPNARRALGVLIDCLEALDRISEEREARLALRTFLSVRKRTSQDWRIKESSEEYLTVSGLASDIDALVRDNSELGKRAQASAAGVLDVWFGTERVVSGRIHDPDARFPGDVGITTQDRLTMERVFEVRDKLITSSDIEHFSVKIIESQITKGGVLAVAVGQAGEDLSRGTSWAEERGLLVVVFTDWLSFVTRAMFWSQLPMYDALAAAYRHVLERLKQLEVLNEGLELWIRLREKHSRG